MTLANFVIDASLTIKGRVIIEIDLKSKGNLAKAHQY